MKTVFLTSVALAWFGAAMAVEPTQEGGTVTHQQTATEGPNARIQAILREQPQAENGIRLGKQARVSGVAASIFTAPRQAWSVISPFGPAPRDAASAASQSDPPRVPFGRPVQSGRVVLLQISFP